MHRWLVGLVPFRDLLANGHARFFGPSHLSTAFPTWFDTTLFEHSLQRSAQRRRHNGGRPAVAVATRSVVAAAVPE